MVILMNRQQLKDYVLTCLIENSANGHMHQNKMRYHLKSSNPEDIYSAPVNPKYMEVDHTPIIIAENVFDSLELIDNYNLEKGKEVPFIIYGKRTKGGAIYIYSNNVTINQSTFVKNGGGSNGGAIYWAPDGGDGDIINCTFINNTADNVRLRRIINEPKRGIGDTSIAAAQEIADGLGIGLFDVIKSADEFPKLSRVANKMIDFAKMIEDFIDEMENLELSELFKRLINVSGYVSSLSNEPETKEERLANLDELANNLLRFSNDNEGATLNDFLQEVALMTDIDNYNAESETVVLMTVHAAKGLEFPVVFLVGMEESIFPSEM